MVAELPGPAILYADFVQSTNCSAQNLPIVCAEPANCPHKIHQLFVQNPPIVCMDYRGTPHEYAQKVRAVVCGKVHVTYRTI